MHTLLGKKFHLELSDPVVIAQAEAGDQVWGHYQFPALCRTRNGGIYASWEYGRDVIEYNAAVSGVVSDDNGKTWRTEASSDGLAYPVMKNGKYFAGFVKKGAYAADYMEKYTPVHVSGEYKRYFAEDIEETMDTTVTAVEIDPETGESTEFTCKINWPHMPLTVHPGGKVYPVTMTFALCNATGIMTLDGDLYFVLYTGGFDSDAKTREDAVTPYTGKSNVYVFRSADSGRTWDYLSQIAVDADTFNPDPAFEGLDEPMMAQMPDGSVVMLIRTGSHLPTYMVRSVDKCRTWSKPRKFDGNGVFPQILSLPCGVTLASYGRPVLKIRASSDPAGMVWEDPITIDLYGMKMGNYFERSCFYTRLLTLDDNTAMLIYTDFHYPNPAGEEVKTVLVRKIRAVERGNSGNFRNI